MEQFLGLSVADIHGNKTQYEKIKQLVIDKQIDAVFLSGDLLPKTGGSWTLDNKVRTIQMQADFINQYFLQYLTELGELTQVYAIFGNDDFKSNYKTISDVTIPGVTFLDNEVTKVPIKNSDIRVAGYPYIGLTPFLHKDWEKWDDVPGQIPHKIYRTDGYSSVNGTHFAVDLLDESATIRDDLMQLAQLSDPAKTIYVFHEAPRDTPLDQIAPDNKYIKGDELHIGSQAIRDFITTKQPLVTMHGHIHETFAESGDYKQRIGLSLSLTAANDFTSDTLAGVLFSFPDTSYVERVQL